MAAREGQGLQIAVIIFALLSIVLAVGCYAFYAAGQTAYKEKEAATAQLQQANDKNKELDYRLKACQYVLGLIPDETAVNDAKGLIATPPADVDEMLAQFKADMEMIEPYKDNHAKNYRTMGAILLNAVNRKQSSVTDANVQVAKAQSDVEATKTREGARAKTAEDARQAAESALNAEKTNYATSIQAIKTEIAAVKADVDTNIKENTTKVETLEKQVASLNSQLTDNDRTISDLKEKRKALEADRETLFEAPDGRIAWVNQRQRLAWIDVGRADGLMRQTTFSVFDHDINGVTNAVPKARIEVVRLSDDHMAECRILEDSASNPILKGDAIHTPAWSPGQRVHFAMAGKMDIDGDKVDDYDTVRNIITLNGGVIDAELRPNGTRVGNLGVNTRYLVLGDPPDDTATQTALQEYTKMRDDVSRYGTDIINVEKLLTQMGWKVEERTVELAGGKGAGSAFRNRKPGQKAAPAAPATPAGEAPAGEPMPPAGEAPTADPFGAPATSAAPAADPFAPAADKPAQADPFAPPK
jgi:predicted  nucleic acid-binding Zn-ribbon protein